MVNAQNIIDEKKQRENKEKVMNKIFVDTQDINLNEWKSDSINEIAVALCEVQKELDGVAKNQTNSFYGKNGKPTYADLHAVQSSVYPIITKYGLSVTQGNQVVQGAVVVTTTLLHTSGQWLRSAVKLPLEKYTAQGVGGAITYGRRYGLSAIIGTAQYDADGNNC